MDKATATTLPRPSAALQVHSRIGDIEVLRAIAVGMVVIHHLPVNLIPWATMGGPFYTVFNFWSGVDLFLAISGFVIARSLLPMLAEARSQAEFVKLTLSFWVRRAWRLLPSAWLWLGLAILGAAVFDRSGAFQGVQANVDGARWAVLNLSNFYMNYAFGRIPLGALGHYWTLSLEEQFYLLLPVVVYLAGRRLPLALVLIVAAQIFIKRMGLHGSGLMNVTRSDALALGVLLAIWSGSASYRKLEPKVLKHLRAPLLLPVLVAVFAALSGPVFGPGDYRISLVALLSAAIVWFASYDRDYIFPPGLLKRCICWIGSRSYAIYLIHLPVFLAAREIWFRIDPRILQDGRHHTSTLLATALLLTLALAELNYRFVETPLRRHGVKIADRIRRRDRSAHTGDVAREAA